jgi:hypothetical protein
MMAAGKEQQTQQVIFIWLHLLEVDNRCRVRSGGGTLLYRVQDVLSIGSVHQRNRVILAISWSRHCQLHVLVPHYPALRIQLQEI